jgi:hypothetical protein
MHRIIEDETANTRIERGQLDTIPLHYQVSRTMHNRPLRIDTMPGWWRNILAWHKTLATHRTNCRTSSMYRLPNEILLLIAKYLNALDTFCLGMSFRQTLFLLQTRNYEASLAREYRLRVGFDVLRLGLEKEYHLNGID